MNTSGSPLVIIVGIVAVVVVLAFVANALSAKKVQGLRSRGVYPQEGQAKEQDVLRLLQAGEKIMAIKCYRELHGVGLKEAKEAVELIERNTAGPRA